MKYVLILFTGLIVMSNYACSTTKKKTAEAAVNNTTGKAMAQQSKDIYDLYIKDELAKCQGGKNNSCLQVKKSPSDSWRVFYEEIEGFTYEKNTSYIIEVERKLRPEGPPDASKYTYHLVKIKEKQSAPITSLIGKWHIHSINGKSLAGRQEGSAVAFTVKNEVSIYVDCNRMNMPYTSDSRQKMLEFNTRALRSTKMGCQESMEGEFISALQKVNRYELSGDQILLIAGRQTVAVLGR